MEDITKNILVSFFLYTLYIIYRLRWPWVWAKDHSTIETFSRPTFRGTQHTSPIKPITTIKPMSFATAYCYCCIWAEGLVNDLQWPIV